MKYLKYFKLFESVEIEIDEYNDYMGKLLHLYGSIPVPKEKSSIVIKKIINNMGQSFKLGENVNLDIVKIYDQIRFSDYFNSLLEDKDVRGHNFEGLIAGLFNGTLTVRGDKSDLVINGDRYSVKFVDHKGKAPEIGRFKYIIEKYPKLNEKVQDFGGLTRIFKSDDDKLKKQIWNKITQDIDGWILAYPDVIDDDDNPTKKIQLNILDKSDMSTILNDGYVVAPKGGYNDYYSLALSSRYINDYDFIKSVIKVPQITLAELKEEYSTIVNDNWAFDVFGTIGYKIRPDVIRYIRNNKDQIIKNLQNKK